MTDLTPAELAARLVQAPPADVPVVRLFLEIKATGGLDVSQLLERREEIEAAARQLAEQTKAARAIGKRCEKLRPRPTRRVPAGI